MSLIWATRGRIWGFRFLRDAGLADPLPLYRDAFTGVEEQPEVCRRDGEVLALRFLDPLKRKDRAGRVIPHDFVVFAPLADRIESVESGVQLIWPLVASEFARFWKSPTPPSASG